MNTNNIELSIELKKVSDGIKHNVLFLESLTKEYRIHSRGNSNDKTIEHTNVVIEKAIDKYHKLFSPELFYKKNCINVQSQSTKIKPDIVKLCNNAVDNGVISVNMANEHLLYIIYELRKQIVPLISHIKKMEKKLSKFLSPDEKKMNDVGIYLNLLKVSKKMPTVEALALSSNDKFSKSSWDRKLKNDRFLFYLIDEIEKLRSRTTNQEKIDFYFGVYQSISKKLTTALNKKSQYAKQFSKGSKRDSKNAYDDYSDGADAISDKNQYDDYASENF